MSKVTIKRKAGVASEANLRPLNVGVALPPIEDLEQEIDQYYDVLLDRVKLDLNYSNPLSLMEIADAFYMRANEIRGLILRAERNGTIDGKRSSTNPYHLFRTGELDSFLESCKRTIETGSRRLSALQFELDKSIRGLSGWGGDLKFD